MKKTICSPQIYRSALLLAVLMLLSSVLGLAQTPSHTTESPASASMRVLNSSLLRLHGQMQQARANDVRLLRTQTAAVIAQRAEALTKLIQSNPHTALSFAFSPELLADLAAKFPQSSSLLESHTTVSGPAKHWVVDYPGLKSSRSLWRMNAGGRSLDLYFAGQEPRNLNSGEVLQATGVLAGSEMAVERSVLVQSSTASNSTTNTYRLSVAKGLPRWQQWPAFAFLMGTFVLTLPGLGGKTRLARGRILAFLKRFAISGLVFAIFVSSSTPSYAQNSCSTTGAQNIGVLMVNLPGNPLPSSVTLPSLQDIFFASNSAGISLDGFLLEASHGQTWAMGDVLGPYNLTGTYSGCSSLGAVLTDAFAAASAASVNMNNYSRVFLVFPDLGCGWAGFAASGCSLTLLNGATYNASLGYIDALYVETRTQGAQLVSHEMGHNLGLLHSGTISAGTNALGPLSSPGTIADMGDVWSTMGAWDVGLYTTSQQTEVLGWMSGPTKYQTITTGGTYTLQPLETSSGALQALKVQRGTGNTGYYLWIEYRQPIGNYDSTLPAYLTQPYSGALIHYEDPTTNTAHSQLANFTPTDTSGNSPALAVGQTWKDPYSNLSLTVNSATSNGLTVTVNYGAAVPTTCAPGSPTITVSPSNPSVYPGNTAAYTLSVGDNDSSGCSSSTFTLDSTQPSGWPTSFSAGSVMLSPGQLASVTMYKTEPSGTPPGTYTVNASATNNTYAASSTANVTVMAAPSITVTLSVPSSTYNRKSTVPIAAAVLYGGSPAAGANLTFTLTQSDGSIVAQPTVTNSNGIGTWSYKLGPKYPTGTYSVSAQATYTPPGAPSTQPAISNTVIFKVQ